jgi:hypothetical protein
MKPDSISTEQLQGTQFPFGAFNVGNANKDATPVLELKSPWSMKTLITSVPVYASNASAVSAGLVVGNFYRTGDTLKIVHS